MEDKVSSISIRTLLESRIITVMTKIFSYRESFGKTVRIFYCWGGAMILYCTIPKLPKHYSQINS